MKSLSKFKNKLTVALLALACGFVAQTASAGEVHEMKSKDYIRITIPEESLADSRLVYGIGGEKVEAFPSHGEVVTLHAEKDDFLGILYFSAYQEAEDTFTFEMTGTNPVGADHFIHFKSTNESAQIEGNIPIYLNAVGAKVEVVAGGSLDEIVPVLPENILIDEQVQDFSKVGMLELRFVVKPTEAPDGEGDANDGGDNNGGDMPELQPATGGCSMLAVAPAGSVLNIAGFAAAAAFGLVLRRRASRK